jgi:hypothetical protein
MKKILPALALLAFCHSAFPQDLEKGVASKKTEVANSLPAMATANDATVNFSDVNLKALRNFNQKFKNVTSEKWYEMPDGYRATFASDGIRNRLDYDKNGNWLHTIRYYDEKKLPVEVRRLVVTSYLDYNIRSVEEIEAPRTPLFYVIHLEGQAQWINIKVADNEIYEIEKIKKS